jgi:hypothetical protein
MVLLSRTFNSGLLPEILPKQLFAGQIGMQLNRLLFLSLVLIMGNLLGCGSEKGIEVHGMISIDGRPLGGAQVKLMPQETGSQTLHTATTDLQGAFVFKDADAKSKIAPGKYVVLVSKVTGGMGSAVNEVPELYGDVNKSPLKIEVTESQKELPPFQLKSKP